MLNWTRIMMAVVVGLSLWGCAKTEPRSELKMEKSGMVSLTATVKDIDMEKRMVTLVTPDGRIARVHAGKEVANLQQVKVGDKVVVLYSEALAVRMARPGEVRDDFSHEMSRAKPGSKPGMYQAVETTVTAKILDIDKPRRTATLKMPDGDALTVKVQDPANLEKVEVGDTIVITYREGLAVSIAEEKQ